jgi:hypothetical protein
MPHRHHCIEKLTLFVEGSNTMRVGRMLRCSGGNVNPHPEVKNPVLLPFEEAAKLAQEKAAAAGAGRATPSSAVPDANSDGTGKDAIPPVLRSVLSFGANTSYMLARGTRCSPGLQGGLFYKGKPFCYSVGYRDIARGLDPDDKGNWLRLRDPMAYGALSTPITGLACWKMHKEVDMCFDMNEPITRYLPELPRFFEGITPRNALSMQAGLSDASVYRTFGIAAPGWLPPRAPLTYHEKVFAPLSAALGGPDATGKQQRDALIKHLVDNEGRLEPVRRLQPERAHASQFALALLVAAMERVAESPFEDVMKEVVFDILDTPSAGYGVPAIIGKSNTFYQAGGLPCGHLTTSTVVPPGDARMAAPPVFNGSLNLFSQPEHFSKLLLSALEATATARKELAPPTAKAGYHELGFHVNQAKNRVTHMQNVRGTTPFTPCAAAVWFDAERDVGSFTVTHCGTRRARLLANLCGQIPGNLFIKQCLDTGMDVFGDEAGADNGEAQIGGKLEPGQEPPAGAGKSPAATFLDKKMFRKVFGKDGSASTSHTRF